MSVAGATGEIGELTAAVFAAVNAEDPTRFAALCAPEVEIHTARGVRRGREEAADWVAKQYDNLLRRFLIDSVAEAPRGGLAVVEARIRYLWREGEELADESPIRLGVRFEADLLAELRLEWPD